MKRKILGFATLLSLISFNSQAEERWEGIYLDDITSLNIEVLDNSDESQVLSGSGVYMSIESNISNDKKCRINIPFGLLYPSNRNQYLAFQISSENPITRFISLKNIQEIKRIGKVYMVKLTSGKTFTGRWVENEPDMYYGHRIKAVVSRFASNSTCPIPVSIKIDKIKKITFVLYYEKKAIELPKGISKTLILTDGETIVAQEGRICDYCGHSGGAESHTRLEEELEIYFTKQQKPDRSSIPLFEIDKIEFIGQGDNRDIVVYPLDGQAYIAHLYLTAESYGGVCNLDSRYSFLDSFEGITNYGYFSIPLAKIQTIKIEHPSKAE